MKVIIILLFGITITEGLSYQKIYCKPLTTYEDWVCGTNRISYVNKGFLECASKMIQRLGRPPINVLHDGKCQNGLGEQDSNQCNRYNNNNPVCGTDGVTYKNPSYLQCESIAKGGRIQQQHFGICGSGFDYVPEENMINCYTTNDYAPCCGSDGETYTNPSYLNCANLKAIPGAPPIFLVHYGKCKLVESPMKPCVMTREMNPVCGSNGQSYNNPSVLKCADNNRELGQPPITILHYGRCGRTVPAISETESHWCFSTNEEYPVCGSDGVTYRNPSLLVCENEKTERESAVVIIHTGPCTHNRILAGGSLPCYPSRLDMPVCGSDGKDYPNPSHLFCENRAHKFGNQVVIAYFGKCGEGELNFLSCQLTARVNQVCGSNGVTYINENLLKCANDHKIPGIAEITVARDGPC